MPRAKKRVTGEGGDTGGPRKKTKGAGGMTRPGSDSGIEKIKLKTPPYLGELLFSGGTNWDLVGRSRLPKSSAGKQQVGGRNLWGPHRLAVLCGIRVSCVVSGPTSCHSVIITEAGKAMSWGRGDKGQLGHGDINRCEAPKLIEGLKDFTIVNAACGRNHTMCLTEEGTVYAFGDNKLGQLGIGHQNTPTTTPTRLMYSGRPIVKVACGGEFTMILDYKGTLHSFGCPEYSQLGHNSNGQYFVTSNKTSFDCVLTPRRIGAFVEKTRDGFKFMDNIVIKDVACGSNHSVALDMQGRVFTWGFRGYGRLGHNELRDEPVPRLLKTFDPTNNRTAKLINAGTSYSMALTEHSDQLYFWGQAKTTGEATMYPKTVQDLSGWKVRCIGCSNHSIVVAAENSIISWGPSPTFGELCYGENGPKSSTQAKEVKPLENIYILTLTCGLGHTLMIAKNDTVAERRALRALPFFNPTRVAVNEPPLEEEEEEEEEEQVEEEPKEEPVEEKMEVISNGSPKENTDQGKKEDMNTSMVPNKDVEDKKIDQGKTEDVTAGAVPNKNVKAENTDQGKKEDLNTEAPPNKDVKAENTDQGKKEDLNTEAPPNKDVKVENTDQGQKEDLNTEAPPNKDVKVENTDKGQKEEVNAGAVPNKDVGEQKIDQGKKEEANTEAPPNKDVKVENTDQSKKVDMHAGAAPNKDIREEHTDQGKTEDVNAGVVPNKDVDKIDGKISKEENAKGSNGDSLAVSEDEDEAQAQAQVIPDVQKDAPEPAILPPAPAVTVSP